MMGDVHHVDVDRERKMSQDECGKLWLCHVLGTNQIHLFSLS